MSSSKFNLNILFVLFSIWWIYFCIFSSCELLEIISRSRFRLIKCYSHIVIKLTGKRITVINSENSLKYLKIGWKIKIKPSIMISQLSDYFWYFLSFEENSLRDTTILYFRFCYKNSLIRKIVINFNFPYPKIF